MVVQQGLLHSRVRRHCSALPWHVCKPCTALRRQPPSGKSQVCLGVGSTQSTEVAVRQQSRG